MSNAEVLGRFVWHELLTTDTAAAAAFYPKVVPWRTAPSNMPGYTIWMAGQTQIGGLMAHAGDGGAGTPAHWLVYIAYAASRCHLRPGTGPGREGGEGGGRHPQCRAFRRAGRSAGRCVRGVHPRCGPPPAATAGSGRIFLARAVDHRRGGCAALLRRAVRLAQGPRTRHGHRHGGVPALRARRTAGRAACTRCRVRALPPPG